MTFNLIEPAGVHAPAFQAARKRGGLRRVRFRSKAEQTPAARLEPGEVCQHPPIAASRAANHLNIQWLDTPGNQGWSRCDVFNTNTGGSL
jgi:hypothetical protein